MKRKKPQWIMMENIKTGEIVKVENMLSSRIQNERIEEYGLQRVAWRKVRGDWREKKLFPVGFDEEKKSLSELPQEVLNDFLKNVETEKEKWRVASIE